MRANGKSISLRYSPNSAFNPSSPSVCPIVEYPNSEGRNSFTPACLAASPKSFWLGKPSWAIVDTTTSMLCSLKAAAKAGTSVSPTEMTLTPAGKDLADDDPGRVTTTTVPPSDTSAFKCTLALKRYGRGWDYLGNGPSDTSPTDDCDIFVWHSVVM